MLSLSKNNPIVGLGFASIILAINYLYWRRRRQADGNPVVSKLIIYPIKSLTGVEVDRLEICTSGVKYRSFRDRSFILLDDSNEMITQKTVAKLALISISLHHNQIWLEAPGMNTLMINNDLDVSSNRVFEFDIHKFNGTGYYYSKEAEDWFSKFLNFNCKLVKFSEDLDLRTTTSAVDETVNQIIYQSRCPILLINQTSIDDLNSRLSECDHVSYRNFRPNIFIEKAGTFAEDKWNRLKIKDLTFRNIQPCSRCLLITVDPDKGVFNTNLQPLKMLRSYRIHEKTKHLFRPNAPLFGVNLTALAEGFIDVGSKLEIIDYLDN